MTEALEIRTPHVDVSDVVRELAPGVDDLSVRLPCERPIADGEWVRFAVSLADGTTVFEGIGRSQGTRPDGPRYRVHLSLLQFDERNEIMFERMLLARDAEEERTGTIDLNEIGADLVRLPSRSAPPPPTPPRGAGSKAPPPRGSIPVPPKRAGSSPPPPKRADAKPSAPPPKRADAKPSAPPPRPGDAKPSAPPSPPSRASVRPSTPAAAPPASAHPSPPPSPRASTRPSATPPASVRPSAPAPAALPSRASGSSRRATRDEPTKSPANDVEVKSARPKASAAPPSAADAPAKRAASAGELAKNSAPMTGSAPPPARSAPSQGAAGKEGAGSTPSKPATATPSNGSEPIAGSADDGITTERALPSDRSRPKKRRRAGRAPAEDRSDEVPLDTVVSRPDERARSADRTLRLEVSPRLVARARALAPTLPSGVIARRGDEEAVLQAALRLGLAGLAALAEADED